MKRTKKITVLIAAAVGLAVLSGCGDDKEGAAASSSAPTTTSAAPAEPAEPAPPTDLPGESTSPDIDLSTLPEPSDIAETPEAQVPPKKNDPPVQQPRREPAGGEIKPTAANIGVFQRLAECMRTNGATVAAPKVGVPFDTASMDRARADGNALYQKVLRACPEYAKIDAARHGSTSGK